MTQMAWCGRWYRSTTSATVAGSDVLLHTNFKQARPRAATSAQPASAWAFNLFRSGSPVLIFGDTDVGRTVDTHQAGGGIVPLVSACHVHSGVSRIGSFALCIR